MKKDLSIIIPVYNEEKNIPILYERLKKSAEVISSDYELIFVNDGSKDTSLLELMRIAEKDDKVFYINFSRNFGHQTAVTAGLDYSKGNAAVVIDGDLQDPPELIPELYAKYKEGYEVVYAQREKRNGESWFKKVTAKYFYRILKEMTHINIPVDTGDFRLIDRKVIECLKQMPEQNKFLRGQIAWIGFRQTAVFFERQERVHGKTNYPFSKMMKLALDGITSFSDKPLSFVTKTGFFISVVSFLIILYAIFSHFILRQTITGWTSLIISSMFIGGIQLLSVGIIGEYISRINKNVLDRPLYIVERTNIE
ncbi:MAG: glycosyltransferase family 2 protein [Bacteroidales bacterium]|jgi:dolichol-phosphate mannosyltransferase|nr:glycosyltransferase family 2 protein [Bacteroidales bacterium]